MWPISVITALSKQCKKETSSGRVARTPTPAPPSRSASRTVSTCREKLRSPLSSSDLQREPANEGFTLRSLGSSSIGNLQMRGLCCVAWDRAALGTFKQGVYAALLGIKQHREPTNKGFMLHLLGSSIIARPHRCGSFGRSVLNVVLPNQALCTKIVIR